MKMNNVNEDFDEPVVANDVESSEKKMLELMAQMQKQATQIPNNTVKNTANTVGITVKPEDDTNYWEITDIPTKYMLYPEGTQIMARPLKVIEIKKLTALTDDNADTVVNDILRRTIRGIDINEIYSADKMYLLLWLRANSFRDNNYVVGFFCPSCSKETSYHFGIDNVVVDYLADDYNPNETVTLANGDVLKFKLLQIKDELALKTFDIKYRSVFEKSGEDVDDELLAISFMIDTVNGSKLDSVKMYEYILNMAPGDFASVTTRLGKSTVGIKAYMNVKCTECGGESQVGLTFHSDFFLPVVKA